MFYGFDIYYFILILPALLFGLWAQSQVNTNFQKYSKIGTMRGMTGAQAAEYILQQNGIYDVEVRHISGHLYDNFNPRNKTINLSDSVYNSTSIAAIGVAAHEAGHAAQYAENYGPIKLRAAIIPITNIGSNLAMPLVLLGLALSFESLAYLGVICFGVSVVFQLITLPVEFDASRRAVKALADSGYMSDEGLSAAKQVLTAAALTYVAALAVAIGNLLRLLTLVNRSRRD